MSFRIEERSSIKVQGKGYEKEHREITDAMEKAINWLATQPVGTEVVVAEATLIKRTA
jgi:DNA integrity scanning protein DisA with diadenylate cyclase activity